LKYFLPSVACSLWSKTFQKDYPGTYRQNSLDDALQDDTPKRVRPETLMLLPFAGKFLSDSPVGEHVFLSDALTDKCHRQGQKLDIHTA
jgi:hypothetical protein